MIGRLLKSYATRATRRENSRLADELAKFKQRVAEQQAAAAIQQQELDLLADVLERNRLRVAAETAAEAGKVAAYDN